MATSIWSWGGFAAFVLAVLAVDLGLLHRRERKIDIRESLLLSSGHVLLALAFAAGVFLWRGEAVGLEFLTGHLIEPSLSLDNVFVMVLIFGYFAVPAAYQHRVLFWGIIGAVVMRAALILPGSALIIQFHWVIYVFGAFLLFTGVKMLALAERKPDLGANPIVRWIRGHFRVTDVYEGNRFFVRRQGLLYLTPLFLALIMVEVSDLVFAVDSIPAIFAITFDPFIVWTSNVFAILGLRALYFSVAGMIERFSYLKYGLAMVLVVVGAKMVMTDVWKMPTVPALAITVALIGGSIVFSLHRSRTAAAVPSPPTD